LPFSEESLPDVETFFYRKKQAWSGRKSDNLDQVKFRCARDTNYSRIAAAAVARGGVDTGSAPWSSGDGRNAKVNSSILVLAQKLFVHVPSNCKVELTLLLASSL
jgi:hypothetical protein